ncbi:MAG TPA: DUF5131 family protein [Aggregatilinea sp.]|uniref:DUF5131 family protein n=1 Tax=Aggregatilinea sp. TaxID=2806333 RepID=UPI002BBA5C14|nr:DUF5131 family protein [Aggregatilinea sp.]HML21839.1 DUF5131 family protein [Aggregatilinea sp.]
MNRQKKFNPDGTIKSRGIEWTDQSWNPVRGCEQGCCWEMEDGSVATCYAKAVAEGVASAAYPNGFEAHYFRPDSLDEPLKLKEPNKIFLGSMTDLFGVWVPEKQLRQVLAVCREAHWHTIQTLTKNPGRLLKFADLFPRNLWVGVSMPPTIMRGNTLTQVQQSRYMDKTLDVLSTLKPRVPVRWLSLEPLSFDVGPMLWAYEDAVNWIVVGAASNGPKKYQPDPEHVRHVLRFADAHRIPVFMKGNLEWPHRREEFPGV